MKKLLMLLLVASSPAMAQNWQASRTSPDISVSATATAEITFDGNQDRLYLKNDCADDIYFDLRGTRDTNTDLYPLLLKQNQEFDFVGRFSALGVSHGSVTTATCTVTLIPFRD